MVVLECVAGRDEHRKIVVDGRAVKIGAAAVQPALAITELDAAQGWLIVRVDEGTLIVDATSCGVPVYVNSEIVRTMAVREPDVLRVGNSVWRARYGGGSLKEHFTQLIGLEELKDFRLGEIFSEVFKRHTEEEMEEQLVTGTSRNTPALADMKVGWARPWLFARLLAVSVVLAFVLYQGWVMFENLKLLPGLIFLGSFAVPISALVFFLEMNVPRNVSIFKITQLLFIGGVASIILALIFFDRTDFLESYLGASAAGIVEESAKMLIVILLMGKSGRYPWALNGLLIGAAVGTGFAAFESAGYAFENMLRGGVAGGMATIELRGILAPFGHIVWTANAAAALWIVRGSRDFSWDMLKAPAFLRIFLSGVILHMIWNAPFTLLRLPMVGDLKFLLLGVVAWVICFRLVQAGLKQLNSARQEEAVAAARALPSVE
jgi:RsiW-degrading membrane proteinase PrsW (M82 family)